MEFKMGRITSGALYDLKTGKKVVDIINAEVNPRLKNRITVYCENCGNKRRIMQYRWNEAESGGFNNRWLRCFHCDRITTFRKEVK